VSSEEVQMEMLHRNNSVQFHIVIYLAISYSYISCHVVLRDLLYSMDILLRMCVLCC